ncbi:glucose-6-phosphate isomerase [Parasphingopyxis lamellibrachiae]|uniref:Glucose-6-phosphate isomerase n=1 Tax=Parasphingopyxis lamellibrachiae TaxID=680125 RepID=A0A3D9FIX8_9SPHN|nr:glucose-6-phosphate isomerase [Parasphingopyxis lamellibrachiae]RED17745.1 glucose-6-phosphate isomerase [Parasphingopyxis lamellibrachiae]
MSDSEHYWQAIASTKPQRLTALFDTDPDRLDRLTVEEAGLYFDFSKTHLDGALVEAFEGLAGAQELGKKRDALFAGEPINISEGRAAEHMAQRGQGAPDSVALARTLHMRMRALIDAIEAGALGEIRHILHLGIGGSALGPDFVIDALGRDDPAYDVAVVSNVDGAALEGPFTLFDPEYTLVVIASKSFTTAETMLNAESALQWMRNAGVVDPFGQMVALTAQPDAAVAFGIDQTRVLPFPDTVGGRYSLWSSIGFPIALALGWEAFEQMLEGAAAMDRHFRFTEWNRNAPALAAFADLYYAQTRRAETRAIFAYEERLRLLPSYLQQLEMESNGKAANADGQPLTRASSPIVWGGVGTDAQHAVFQLLHQGTHLVPVEFVAVAEAHDHRDPAHHEQLLVNCFAQGSALMTGRASDDPARHFAGDRPSSTILLERLDPASLGALLAFYEHRTFVNAALLGINPFDQFGVELGKDIARAIAGDEDTLELDASTRALIDRAL